MRTHFELQNTIIADMTKMKGEIEEIKTHFATKADMIKWVVGVGVATIVSIAGFVWNLTSSMDIRLSQDIRELRGMVATLAQESKETRQAVAILSKKIDEQSHKRT